MFKFAVVILSVAAVAFAQRGGARVRPIDNEVRQTTTPVPILRQINKVGEDGSYTYGYEAADGSYKIETKAVTGEVQGKYGYYDDAGTLREIEYGASRQGFHPQGTDVRAPVAAVAMSHDPFDDSGQYDSNRYEKPFAYDPYAYQTEGQQQQQPARRPGGRKAGARRQQKQFTLPAPQQQYQPAPQQQYQPAPQQQQYRPAPQQQQYQPAPQQQYQPAPQQQYQPQPQHQHTVTYHGSPAAPAPTHPPAHYQQQYQPQAPRQPHFNPSQLFQGHPAQNFDVNTGSYSLNYSG